MQISPMDFWKNSCAVGKPTGDGGAWAFTGAAYLAARHWGHPTATGIPQLR
jgi:hypothetical protein